jgi:hypothetical protein
MDDGYTQTLSGLIRKRKAMLDELYQTHDRLQRLLSDIPAIEAAIYVLGPEIELEAVREIAVKLPKGEQRPMQTARSSMAVLRKAGRPMTTRDIARQIMTERGLDVQDHAMLRVMTTRVLAALRPQRERGLVRSSPGEGVQLQWEVVR